MDDFFDLAGEFVDTTTDPSNHGKDKPWGPGDFPPIALYAIPPFFPPTSTI